MTITSKSLKEVKKRVEKLQKIEEELIQFEGFAISITRLTILKYLCRSPFAMCQFACYISGKTRLRIKYEEGNEDMEKVVNESIELMEGIIERSKLEEELSITKETEEKIFSNLRKFWNYQNEIEKVKWTNVRQIKNWNILLIEKALNCFKYQNESRRGYELGRSYTEKYEPLYGTGLIPRSLELFKDIKIFLEEYYEKMELDFKLKEH